MNDEAQKPNTSAHPRRPKGGKAWKVVKEYADPKSGLGIRITKRTKGAPAFNWQIVKINENGPATPHIPHPCFGTDHAVEDIVFSLVKAAVEYIDTEREKLAKLPVSKPKAKSRDRDRKRDGATGLSQLAKQDAEAKGLKYQSKTERKKQKRKQAQ